jgi:hypothetical protein
MFQCVRLFNRVTAIATREYELQVTDALGFGERGGADPKAIEGWTILGTCHPERSEESQQLSASG